LKIKEYRFEYIPRSANSLAHILAKETLKRKIGVYLVGGVPEVAEEPAASERKKIGIKLTIIQLKTDWRVKMSPVTPRPMSIVGLELR
ncbi:hypothetical protein Goari_009826, partial [Gossypium aridum]|nr:hypothetical protein [Gossypium aridum]